MAYCSKCGAELNDGAKFCSNCGNSIDGGNVQSSNSIDKGVNNSQKKSKTIPVLVIILVLLLLGGLGWHYSNNRGNKYSLEKLALVTNGMDKIANFHEGLAFFLSDIFYNDGMAMVRKNGKYGFIDKEGKEIISCKYDEAIGFNEGLAVVKKDGKYGFLDKKGKEVIPFIYSSANAFSNGLSAVGKDGKYGFINKKGETIIPFVFDYAESFNGESTIASKGDKSVIINKEGKIVKEFESGYLRDFSEGLAIYEKDENDELRYGYVDEKGNLIIPRKFYSLRGIYGIFEDGFASVYKYAEGKFGVIDKSGKEVLPFKFESDILYSEELFLVYNNGKAGYYDTNGKCVIPCEYETATPFYEGLAAVEKGGLWGFIDKSGKMLINPVFDDVNSFSDGLAVVKKNDKYGIVDKNGKSTFSPQELEKLNIQKEETIEKEEEQYEEESMEYEEESNSKQVDITPILYECQNEITAIQREIEEACRTFVVLGSQDVDMYKYTQMKSTFLDGVSDLERQADRAFDKCARELKEAGYPDAVDKINEEKRQFHSAIYSLTTRATQQSDMSY